MAWLITNFRLVLITVLAAVIVALVSFVKFYHHSATEWKEKSQDESALSDSRLKIIAQMQEQQKVVSAIDDAYQLQIKAKDEEIDSLRARVESGAVRLRVKATCPTRVPKASTTASGLDATSAELDPDARQNYYTLRSQIAQASAQIEGLQDYIRGTQ